MILIRFIFLLLLFIRLSSCREGAEEKIVRGSVITKSFQRKSSFVNDTPFFHSLRRVYGDSFDTEIGKLNLDSLNYDEGEFVSASYKFGFTIKPGSWTNDFEDIFSSSERNELDSIVSEFEKETTIQIVVVTIDSTWTTAQEFDSLVLKIGNDWGVGQKETNNGIIIGISAGLRRIRIWNGDGIVRKLPDTETKKIIDEIFIPDFRQDKYYSGTRKGLMAIIDKVR